MKIKMILTLFIALLLTLLSGCMDISQDDQDVKVTVDFSNQVTIEESKLMNVHSTLENDEFTFTSSDETIITIDSNGLVTGIGVGEAIITITSTSGNIVNHPVTVDPILYVESIRLVIEEHETYYAGVSYKYNIEFLPEDSINQNVRFSYSNPNVVIDESDKTITFTRACESNVLVFSEDDWNIRSNVDFDVEYDTNLSVYDLLFVGNSLTKYTNNIPLMVKNMIENDGSIVYIDYSTNNQYLDQHNLEIEKFLDQNKYTHVILQEQSNGLTTDFNRFKESVLMYNDMIIANGANTVLYQTWTYNYPAIESKQAMHKVVSEGYKEMALEINSMISLVGDVFMDVIINNPRINLYADLNHPSIYGAYLSALVHYKTITGNIANSVEFIPDGISVEIATILKNAVDKIIS